MRKYLVGFDPGGEGSFGWCVIEDRDQTPVDVVRGGIGIAVHAAGAVEAAYKVVQDPAGVIGVGIDAPLYWIANGDRRVDQLVRQQIVGLGAPNGTVQAVNSLRGACLVQGMLAGVLSRQRTGVVPISESHPKAMLWLLNHATPQNSPARISILDLQEEFNVADQLHPTDHERDAALACLSAWAMVHESPPGWVDISMNGLQEEERHSLITPPPSYWMPKARVQHHVSE